MSASPERNAPFHPRGRAGDFMVRSKPQTPHPSPLPKGEREHSASAAKQRSNGIAMRRAAHIHPLAPLGRGLGRGGDFMHRSKPQPPHPSPLPKGESERSASAAKQRSNGTAMRRAAPIHPLAPLGRGLGREGDFMAHSKPQAPHPNPLPKGEREHSLCAAKLRPAETAMRRAAPIHPLTPLGRGLGRGGDLMARTETRIPPSSPFPTREWARFAAAATQHST